MTEQYGLPGGGKVLRSLGYRLRILTSCFVEISYVHANGLLFRRCEQIGGLLLVIRPPHRLLAFPGRHFLALYSPPLVSLFSWIAKLHTGLQHLQDAETSPGSEAVLGHCSLGQALATALSKCGHLYTGCEIFLNGYLFHSKALPLKRARDLTTHPACQH